MAMRIRLLTATAFSLLAAQAFAADFGLRGPIIEAPQAMEGTGVPDWGGFYVGGMIGQSFGGASLTQAYNGLATAVNASTNGPMQPLQGPTTASGSKFGFGGFIGYQVPFEDTVVGIEADYFRLGLNTSATQTNIYTYGKKDYTQSQTTGRTIDDLMTVRMRGGYTFGNLMFYGTAGFAYGRSTYFGSVKGNYNDGSGAAFTTVNSESSASSFGLAYGLGLEAMLANRIMLRGEYLGVTLRNYGGTETQVNMIRAGLAYKFGAETPSYAVAPQPVGFMPQPLVTKN